MPNSSESSNFLFDEDETIIPYIKVLHINDCYAHKGLKISTDEKDGKFRHILLTGKNGSGKTTILNHLSHVLDYHRNSKLGITSHGNMLRKRLKDAPEADRKEIQKSIQDLENVQVGFSNPEIAGSLYVRRDEYILAYFVAGRRVDLHNVSTVTTEDEFASQLASNVDPRRFVASFKQYLVNKKIYEAFDFIAKKRNSESAKFFTRFTSILRQILKDPKLELIFEQESFEFYLHLSDGRRLTFNQLSDGFSAFLNILMDLLMRSDLIRKKRNDFSYEVPGFVLIDEPETHFHLEMQYEILPLITAMFPKLQLIIATHSPAVISSLENSVVFDLSSNEQVSDWVLGSSYSELMMRHFGLDNEFSNTADEILRRINLAASERNLPMLKNILETNSNYLTPSLRIEIESRIIELKNKSQ